MGFIIDFIKKLLGVKEVLTVIIFALNVSYFVALGFFIVSLIKLLVSLQNLIKDLFNKSTGGQLAGSDSLNNYNDIAWSVLHSYGIIDVFNTFLPLIFSTFIIYFTLFASQILLDFKRKMINALQEATMIL